MAIELPLIDPVALAIGPLEIRWYALSYLAGFLLGWRYCLRLVARATEGARPNSDDIDDFLTWAVLGVIVGGRLGYVLFYQSFSYLSDPLEILRVWHGGMSFHGGMVGVLLAMVFFARARQLPVLRLSDVVCAAAPIGLFFGRIANFINAELLGRKTDLPWGVVFPSDEFGLSRHPSQIYEALLEGALLFLILYFIMNKSPLRERAGLTTGVFLAGYGVFRALVELVRQPDSQVGYIMEMFTMGQLLCVPMIVAGIALCAVVLRKNPRPE
jgi:phosphatidylglycerol---prolipoprotein diacylglyceryl transferase